MTECWKLRVDLEVVSLDVVLHLIDSVSNVYCYVREKLDTNPHAHFYLETVVKEATIRNKLRKLGLTGNGKYSMKHVDKAMPVEYLAYMLKEGKPVYVNIPPEVIEESKKYNEEVKASIKAKKEAKKTQLQQIEEDIPDLSERDVHGIINGVVMWYKEKGILIRQFQLTSICQTLALKYTPDYVQKLENKILQQMTPSI